MTKIRLIAVTDAVKGTANTVVFLHRDSYF